MASGGADEEGDARSGSTSKTSSSKQLLVTGSGSRASDERNNEKFVLENVEGTVTEQVRPIPSFNDPTVEDTARDIGNAMISVEKGELKEVRGDKNKNSFQTRLRPGFEKMLELCVLSGDVEATVRQGSYTSTDIGNFTKGISSRPDISIVLTNGNKAAVCGLCEVKVDKNCDVQCVHARNQLYVELVTKQRSTQKAKDGNWLLIGLVLTEKRAYITQLRTGTWWGYLAEVTSIDRYNFDATDNLSLGYQMLAVIREYLQRLFTNFNTDQLFCATHELAYFAYPSTADIVRFSAPHIVKCRFKTVRKYLSVASCKWSNECGPDDEVVVKVVSNAVYKNESSRLSEFLLRLKSVKNEYENHVKVKQLEEQLRRLQVSESEKKEPTDDTGDATAGGPATQPTKVDDTDDMKPKEQPMQPTKPQDYVYSLLANHVWLGSCTANQNTAVCITRCLGERVCRSPEMLSKWAVKGTRQAFFDHVCVPALGVIQFGYYHGDIRLPNIVVQEQSGTFKFSLVDWDEMIVTEKDRGVKKDRRYPIKLTVEQRNLWKNDPAKWAQLFTVCQLYMCATILNMVASTSDPEAEACELERAWKEEAHFWEEQCPKNAIHRFDDEHGTSGLMMLRSLMKTQPDELLSGKLSNLLIQMLKLA